MTNDPLANRPLPAWFDDAKLGIFIHWGPYSVPGWAPLTGEKGKKSPWVEEYQSWMAMEGSETARYHADQYGDLPYEAFGEQFRAAVAQWDPGSWADLFERAGARYVVMTTKTEDSFLMWPSTLPHPRKEGWQVERDLVGELSAALARRGIRFGTYYSGLDYTFSPVELPIMGSNRAAAMPTSPEWIAFADAHWRELIERYRTSVLWGDWGFPESDTWHELFRWYLERVPDGVINDRFVPFDSGAEFEPGGEKAVHRDFVTVESVKPERGNEYAPDVPAEGKWESCREMGNSWAYNRQEDGANYPSTADLIRELCDVVARGGNFLLNVGPTATGEIPWIQAERLLGLGWWLRRYGEAIYGTRKWARSNSMIPDGLDVRYTASEDAVHAIVLGTPKQASVDLDVRLDAAAEVVVDGTSVPLKWESGTRGVRVTLTDTPPEQPAIALRLSPRAAVHAD